MLQLYTTSGCSSCRKAKKWLEDNKIEFVEKNIFTTPITIDELSYILERTENGTDDIISVRSKVISEGDIDLDSMTLHELFQFIIEHPSALRRPIIISERSFQVGFNEDEIRVFIPKELRDYSCHTCENFDDCDLYSVPLVNEYEG